MKIVAVTALALLVYSTSSFGQGEPSKNPQVEKPPAANANDPARAAADSALAAHGGDKLRQMKSFVVRGSADIAGSPTFVVPATFSIVIAGDRYAFELNNPFQPLKQIYDGKQVYSSGYELPPVTSLGFPMLAKIGDAAHPITPLPAKTKKKGFRITTPDGFYTDFFTDEKTGQIKGYESSYDVNGRLLTTSVEIDKFETVEGVLVPKKYSQRFDLGQNMTAYASFNTKVILVNSPVPDDTFAMPK